jgi:hypothetical protein
MSMSGPSGAGSGRRPRGVVVVMEGLMKYLMRSGTSAGVTWSTMVKLGRRRTVVGCFPDSW